MDLKQRNIAYKILEISDKDLLWFPMFMFSS